jgi:4-amino-4-deoxy-L-arabinose transferase-like glycosyltransferase
MKKKIKVAAADNPSSFILLCTTIVSFFFFLWGINSWRFAYVGDEWPFYTYAQSLINTHVLQNPLSFAGVFHSHSPLASYYQALFMLLFGVNNFSWRLSNVILIFPISFFFYLFVKSSFNKEIAFFSTILLQCSFYLANFFKIGYDNPQSLTLFIICLFLAQRLVKEPVKEYAFLLGLTLGLSFYVYIGPLFPLFISPYILPLLWRLSKHRVRKSLLIFAGSYLILLSPVLFHPFWLRGVLGSIGVHQDFLARQTILQNFLLFYKNDDFFYNHFVVGPYLDIISALFCLIGSVRNTSEASQHFTK